ncbi:MAG: hypothetical protein KZQ64_15125 [gamma proteobacterium symbiont of Bathyaustriella thionipta]|nr:hypothetical protein [gamma proteobacterium symbiont of Bathyaustriella thionipta]MCU7949959.1 hypothetical protein [gamma proteobacterium symbiont of Bathyaustriella thionipta]MCU7954701.1 hypothetical protein [gamma proteobacterium symbiont of Bathyaustriella thionipta]MCU7956524.1 hypothetical protein [gamma proteobacterium symbiont of Bathyaustriella thionipta]
MNNPIVVIGIGEMSSVFTRALLRAGNPLIPITRDMNIAETAQQITTPEMVLVAVGESDLDTVLEQLPEQWKDKIALLQNELLPSDWKKHHLIEPTVISVWFEKKPGQDFKVLVPSPIVGPKADILAAALKTLSIPTWIVKDDNEMLFELVRKNLFILTTNIAGLEVGGDVNALWNENRDLALRVMDDVLTIQNHLTDQQHDRERLIEAMVEAINGDLAHKCMGRSAPVRLSKAIDYAKKNNLQVNELQRIYKNKGNI